MDIQAMIIARRAELQLEQERQATEVAELRQAEIETAKKAALERLNLLERSVKEESEAEKFPVAEAPYAAGQAASLSSESGDDLVEKEFDALINKKAAERWTSSENWILAGSFIGSIIFIFVAFPLGVFFFGIALVYLFAKQRHYRGVVRNELGLPSVHAKVEKTG